MNLKALRLFTPRKLRDKNNNKIAFKICDDFHKKWNKIHHKYMSRIAILNCSNNFHLRCVKVTIDVDRINSFDINIAVFNEFFMIKIALFVPCFIAC